MVNYNLQELKIAVEWAREQKDLYYRAGTPSGPSEQTPAYIKAVKVFNDLYYLYDKTVQQYIKELLENADL